MFSPVAATIDQSLGEGPWTCRDVWDSSLVQLEYRVWDATYEALRRPIQMSVTVSLIQGDLNNI